MTKIYITHCSKSKNDRLEKSKKKVTPDNLYTSTKIQAFINTCKLEKVNWAIFSDKYGVVFPNDEIEWYEKSPNNVTIKENEILLDNFLKKLSKYDEIYFYHNPSRFHHFYKSLLENAMKHRKGIKLISHVSEIKR